MADAGRELDAMVAEAMGAQPGCSSYLHGEDGPIQPHARHYSTDIRAAWEVVEWMIGRGWHFSLEFDEYGWHASFVGVGEDATAAPLAICRAFLAELSRQKTIADHAAAVRGE